MRSNRRARCLHVKVAAQMAAHRGAPCYQPGTPELTEAQRSARRAHGQTPQPSCDPHRT